MLHKKPTLKQIKICSIQRRATAAQVNESNLKFLQQGTVVSHFNYNLQHISAAVVSFLTIWLPFKVFDNLPYLTSIFIQKHKMFPGIVITRGISTSAVRYGKRNFRKFQLFNKRGSRTFKQQQMGPNRELEIHSMCWYVSFLVCNLLVL